MNLVQYVVNSSFTTLTPSIFLHQNFNPLGLDNQSSVTDLILLNSQNSSVNISNLESEISNYTYCYEVAYV